MVWIGTNEPHSQPFLDMVLYNVGYSGWMELVGMGDEMRLIPGNFILKTNASRIEMKYTHWFIMKDFKKFKRTWQLKYVNVVSGECRYEYTDGPVVKW